MSVMPRITPRSSRAVTKADGGLVIATVARPDGSTGVHAHTRAIREGVAATGLPCEVVSPFSGGKKWLPIFAVRPLVLDRLNKTWSTQWYRHWHAAALRENLFRRMAERPAAAVLAQCPLSARVALDVREALGARRPIALVCHFNVGEAHEYREKGELENEAYFQSILALEADVFRRVDRVIHVSNWSKESVERGRGLIARESSVIWNGIAADPPPGRVARASLGLAEDDLVLINVGTIEPRKNQIGLLDLFARIVSRHASARLVLVGDGPQRGVVERAAASLGLSDRVRLLGTRPDVPALLALADLYIHYATLENCPVAYLEAARGGLPAAAIGSGGLPELQEALQSGVPLTAGDTEASLAAIEPLLVDADLRSRLGLRARERFLASFTREAMTAAYIDTLGLTPPSRASEPGGGS